MQPTTQLQTFKAFFMIWFSDRDKYHNHFCRGSGVTTRCRDEVKPQINPVPLNIRVVKSWRLAYNTFEIQINNIRILMVVE